MNSRADPPRAAVGLVGDREVEARGSALEGGGDLGRGLVGGEHDPPPPAAQEGGDHVGVGGDRQPQLGGVLDELVLARRRVSSEQTAR